MTISRRASKKSKAHPVDWTASKVLLVIARHWPWLLFAPIVVAATASGIYYQMPSQERIRVVLNVDLAVMQRMVEPIEEETTDVAVHYEQGGRRGEVIVTAETFRTSAASAIITEIIDSLPSIAPPKLRLDAENMLELRAQRQYLEFLAETRTKGSLDDSEGGRLAAEIVAVERRIAQLAPFEEPERGEPTVVDGPTVLENRRPPLRNVVLFSYMLTLFTTWLTICGIEQRRLRDQDTAA